MHPPDPIGRTIAHYRIEDKIGQGGFGVVYAATDLHLNRRIALKILPEEGVADAERAQRFALEARAASALNHPNIVTIHDIDTADGVMFIAMEFVAGKPLDQLIGHRGLPLVQALGLAAQIADALTAAHAAGIIHRDLKPQNVMVTDTGLVKVVDFGLAKLVESPEARAGGGQADLDTAQMTREGIIAGTCAYMSPEQAEGKRIDTRSDIFSFGAVLYEMLTGRRAFQQDTTMSTLAAVLNKDPAPLSQLSPTLPREVERLVTRCLRKEPARRPQHMSDIKLELEELKEELTHGGPLSAAMPAAIGARSRRAASPALVGAAGLLALAALAMWVWTREPPPRPRVLDRLTSDPGLTAYPALSPGGHLLAYASDRAGEGSLDIWVRPAAGGEAIRLTDHEADDYEPAFSPDGGSIAFRSERDGGGIYVVSALGGPARLLARHGRTPRFSPSGEWVAFWTGEPGGAGFDEQVHVVSISGEQSRRVQPEFGSASHPIWSPDGQRLLFLGKRDPQARWPDTADWWTTPIAGGPAAPTGAVAVLGRDAFVEFAAPASWRGDTNTLVFSQRRGDTTNLWEVAISPRTLSLAGTARQLTFGTGVEVQPTIDGDRLAFAALVENIDVWALPVEANDGRVTGPLQRLTHDGALDHGPNAGMATRDIVFVSNRLGNHDLWLIDGATGDLRALTRSATQKMYPVLSDDGRKVAYGSIERQSEIYVLPTSGGPAEKVCDDCGLARSWLPDGSALVYQGGEPRRLGLLQLSAGMTRVELAGHPQYSLFSARVSPDGRWIAFFASLGPTRTRIYAAPLDRTPASLPVPESRWVAVTSGQFRDDKPRWSPDGRLMYFTSVRDGFYCIWAQRLQPDTKQPVGDPFVVQHFHQARLSLMYIRQDYREMTVGADRLVFSGTELTGNLWLSRPESSQ